MWLGKLTTLDMTPLGRKTSTQTNMKDLVHIWNDKRYRSKVLFIITPTHAYDLKVKVTEIFYLSVS